MAEDYRRDFPTDTLRVTTGCQYCAVGCGYNAFLVGESDETVSMDGVSRFMTPAMRNKIRYRGKTYDAAVAPDVRCDLNKGNHSVRGGSQGENLITHDGKGRSTQDRLKSPLVRLADGRLHEISWAELNAVMARLLVRATRMQADKSGQRIQVKRPEALGVKIYEYQYLENTYAATKLFYSALGTPNVAYHDRPSAADSSPGLEDVGFRPHDFSYDDVRQSDVLVFIGTNPYENQSVFLTLLAHSDRF
jgi:arsenite oxidase large subunit